MRELSPEEVKALGLDEPEEMSEERELSPEEVSALGLDKPEAISHGGELTPEQIEAMAGPSDPSFMDKVHDYMSTVPTADEVIDSYKTALTFGAKGLTSGLTDEAYGGVKAVIDVASPEYEMKDLLDRYYKGKEEYSAEEKRLGELNPKTALASEIAGSVGQGALIAPLGIASKAGTLAKLGGVALKGAAESGLQAFGESEAKLLEGEAGELAKDVGTGALIGGGMGGALGGLGMALTSEPVKRVATAVQDETLKFGLGLQDAGLKIYKKHFKELPKVQKVEDFSKKLLSKFRGLSDRAASHAAAGKKALLTEIDPKTSINVQDINNSLGSLDLEKPLQDAEYSQIINLRKTLDKQSKPVYSNASPEMKEVNLSDITRVITDPVELEKVNSALAKNIIPGEPLMNVPDRINAKVLLNKTKRLYQSGNKDTADKLFDILNIERPANYISQVSAKDTLDDLAKIGWRNGDEIGGLSSQKAREAYTELSNQLKSKNAKYASKMSLAEKDYDTLNKTRKMQGIEEISSVEPKAVLGDEEVNQIRVLLEGGKSDEVKALLAKKGIQLPDELSTNIDELKNLVKPERSSEMGFGKRSSDQFLNRVQSLTENGKSADKSYYEDLLKQKIIEPEDYAQLEKIALKRKLEDVNSISPFSVANVLKKGALYGGKGIGVIGDVASKGMPATKATAPLIHKFAAKEVTSESNTERTASKTLGNASADKINSVANDVSDERTATFLRNLAETEPGSQSRKALTYKAMQDPHKREQIKRLMSED